MASDFDWTADAVTCLRAFWQDGHSTAEIGRRMGVSKNAVVGKAHRLHLPPRPSPIRAKSSGERPPARERTRIRRGGPSLPLPQVAADSAPPQLPQAAPPAARPAMPPTPRPVRQEPCCWPIGHPGRPGFRFCDADAMPRKPYCAEHAGTAYVAPETARDRPDGRSLDRYLRRGLTRTP